VKVSVLGAGAWGTALAATAAARHETLLWSRDVGQARSMAAERRNRRYLDEIGLPAALDVTHDLGVAIEHSRSGLLIIATPMSGLRNTLQALPGHWPAIWLCKGFESGSGALGHEVARAVHPGAACGVLSGPSFALEVARGQPTALVAASDDAALLQCTVDVFHGDALRIYTSSDLVGVEVGGAVKNVLAIATGMLDGLAESAGSTSAPGLNARAALITRGLAEMTRFGLALGARAETFMGLSGLGDLVLTSTGALSRNRKVGLLLAAGRPLDSALAELGHVAEGVYSARTVVERGRAAGVEMPIAEAVVAVLEGQLSPPAAMARLMSRQARSET
jgi:glycerol-3-phosphate dehydrogenase (NAD(P)+)